MGQRSLLVAATAGALISTALWARAASGAEGDCPSPSDLAYPIVNDDTLSQIAARAYCQTSAPGIHNAWTSLATYNQIPIGPNPHRIFTKTVICLPERISLNAWEAARCISADSVPGAAATAPSVCGNNRKEGQELCDGQDLGGLTCEMLGLEPSGKLSCRADCRGLDASACVPPKRSCKEQGCPPPEPPPAPEVTCAPAKSENLLRRVAADVLIGLAVPLVGETRDYIYPFIFTAGLGVRLTLGWLEVAPRVVPVMGFHGIIFNDIEQDQRILGVGGQLQLGVPIETETFRFQPGVEGGLLYVDRRIDRIDYPFEGQVEKQSGAIPFAGVFFRPEYTFGKAKGLTVAAELSLDLILASLAGNEVTDNFNAKVLGGVGYAF